MFLFQESFGATPHQSDLPSYSPATPQLLSRFPRPESEVSSWAADARKSKVENDVVAEDGIVSWKRW